MVICLTQVKNIYQTHLQICDDDDEGDEDEEDDDDNDDDNGGDDDDGNLRGTAGLRTGRSDYNDDN